MYTNKQKLYVLIGDVVSSKKITDKKRGEFQKRLEKTCQGINTSYNDDISAYFKILKGIDEIGGVLSDISYVYEILKKILEGLYPNFMRFVLVLDYIDTALYTKDVAKMDGPAFHKASDMMYSLKKSKLLFDMSVGDLVVDSAISGQINLILLLKKTRTKKQHQIVLEYERTKNQHEVAKNLEITQQAVSKTLRRSMWGEISGIEKKLNDALYEYSKR